MFGMSTLKSFLLVSLFLLLFAGNGFSQSSGQKVLILPLHNDVDISVYSDVSAETTHDIIFYSLYGLVGTLPSIDVPQKEDLIDIDWTEDELSALGIDESADLILYGDFNYSGSTGAPTANISVYVYDVDKETVIYENQYETDPTDVDIFDDMDIMALDIIEQVFLIRANIAYLRLDNFLIANDVYKIYINNKHVTSASNVLFEYDQKLLSGIDYNIMVERQRDNALVLNSFINLDANETTNLSYEAGGQVEIGRIRGMNRRSEYKLLLDGEEISEEAVVSNLSPTMDHSLIILEMVEGNQIIVARTNFSIIDDEFVTMDMRIPKDTGDSEPIATKPIMVHIYAGQSSFGGAGIEWNLSDNFWLGATANFSIYDSQILDGSILTPGLYLETGYRLLNSVIALSAGLTVGGTYSFAMSDYNLQNYYQQPFSLITGPFVQLDWKFLFLRAGSSFDPLHNMSFKFAPSVGVRF